MGSTIHEATISMDVEASLNAGIADHDSRSADGALMTFTSLDLSGLQQATVPNENIKQRAFATNAPLLGLKSGAAFTGERYMHGGVANAAEGAQAALAPDQDTLFKNFLGGLQRGYAAGLNGGTAAAPTVETGEGSANFGNYEWVFAYDTSATTGWFRRVKSWATDTATMDDGHDLPFTPDAADDVFHAVTSYYLDRDALISRGDANYTTLTFYIQGDASDSTWEPKGCKVTISIGAIEQGQPTKLSVSVKAVSFDNENESAPTLSGTPVGAAGQVVGSGNDTHVFWATHDAALAALETWTVTPNIGIDHVQELGPNGQEGVHGYTATGFDDTGVTLTVPYSDDYAAEFRAETRKHLLIQVGTSPLNSWAIYFDNAPMDVLVYGNICARNTLGGIMISHYGKNVTIENNIFVDSGKSQAYLLFAGQMSNVRFKRNIFSALLLSM